MTEELTAKRLQLLHEAMPSITRIGILWNPDFSYSKRVIEQLETAAVPMSITLSFLAVRIPDDIDSGFLSDRRADVQAFYVIEDGRFFNRRMIHVRCPAKIGRRIGIP